MIADRAARQRMRSALRPFLREARREALIVKRGGYGPMPDYEFSARADSLLVSEFIRLAEARADFLKLLREPQIKRRTR